MGRPGKHGGKAERDSLRTKMLAQGCTVDQIAEEFRVRWQFPPLAAHRYASGLTQYQAASRYNEVVSDATASVDNSLISKLELWPGHGGKAPTAYNLAVLAVVYGTEPYRLVAPGDVERLARRDQLLLHGTNTKLATSLGTTSPVASPHSIGGGGLLPGSVDIHRTARSGYVAETLHRTHSVALDRSITPSPVVTPGSPYYPGQAFDNDHIGAVSRQSQAFAMWAEASNIGPVGIDALSREIARLARAYVHAPLEPIFRDLVMVRDQIVSLLHGRQRLAHTRQLFKLAGATCVLLAHASDDLGHTQDGLAQVQSAWICAEQADDPALKAWALATEALIREYHGQAPEALDLTRQGQVHVAEMSMTGSVAAWLSALEARSAARLGRGDDANAALARAHRARDAINASDELCELDVLGGLFTFVPAKQTFYEGATMLQLGDARRAEAAAERAIEEYVSGPVEQRSYGDESLARLDLASARLRRGELDGTADALDGVLSLPPELRIDVLGDGIKSLSAELSRGSHRTARIAVELRQALLDSQAGVRPELHSA